MEKHITHWGYWLGVACFAIALVWRALNGFGVGPTALQSFGYTAFYKAALLLFVTTIATANYAWIKGQKS